jgi:hypothetical protein
MLLINSITEKKRSKVDLQYNSLMRIKYLKMDMMPVD